MKKFGVLAFLLLSGLWATVNLQLVEEQGRTAFERNSTYVVYARAIPDRSTMIGALGELYVEYDPKVFVTVNVLTQDYHVLPSTIWESQKINFQSIYATQAGWRCIEYAKTDNNGPYWTITNQQNIFRIAFVVRPNAPLGSTSIRWVYAANNNRTKLISATGEVIPVTVQSLPIQIGYDQTRPVTMVQPAAGLYKDSPALQFKVSEDAALRYRLVGLSGAWQEISVSANMPTPTYVLPATTNEVTRLTLEYTATDRALGVTSNQEDVHSVVYTVDRQKPVISAILVPSAVVPVGMAAEVRFMASDLVDIGTTAVLIGNKPAIKISSTGVGSYVYRRVIDGSEQTGAVSITVTDTAGNVAIDTTARVLIDFNGPSFIDITSDPVSPQINQEVVISFAATELLSMSPTVTVGVHHAYLVKSDKQSYQYAYTVTSNGWYVDLSFIPDQQNPFTERNRPARNASQVPVNTAIYFRIGDNDSVATASLSLAINSQVVYSTGKFRGGYTGRLFVEGSKVSVICLPPLDFMVGQVVTVSITVADTAANTLNETYIFTVGTVRDVVYPIVSEHYPLSEEKSVSVLPLYYFVVHDAGAGVVPDRLNYTLVERYRKANYYNEKDRFKTIEATETDEREYRDVVITHNVIVNGVVQPGYVGALAMNETGDLICSIIPNEPLHDGATINCLVNYQDLTRAPNNGQATWTFFTVKASAGAASMGSKIPLAYPTIFNPDKVQWQYLTFSVVKAMDIEIRMYDLSGDMIWRYDLAAQPGYQAVPWDGRNAHGKYVGNGPYIWYIVQRGSQKVIGRGTSVIMR